MAARNKYRRLRNFKHDDGLEELNIYALSITQNSLNFANTFGDSSQSYIYY